jgi:uncharacterized protein YidB (DUF937 family)
MDERGSHLLKRKLNSAAHTLCGELQINCPPEFVGHEPAYQLSPVSGFGLYPQPGLFWTLVAQLRADNSQRSVEEFHASTARQQRRRSNVPGCNLLSTLRCTIASGGPRTIKCSYQTARQTVAIVARRLRNRASKPRVRPLELFSSGTVVARNTQQETPIGLMDVLNGMRDGPRGQVSATRSNGGMSPLTMGLLALLAYKAYKGGSVFGSSPAASSTSAPSISTRSFVSDGSGDWLSGLGNLIAGGGGGSILTSGLGEFLNRLHQTGQGQIGQSWVGAGQNQPISTSSLQKALGADTLDALSRQTGIPRDHMLAELADQLPNAIDNLTPDGRVPTEYEASRWV